MFDLARALSPVKAGLALSGERIAHPSLDLFGCRRGYLFARDRRVEDARVRDAQEGRAEVVQMWGRPESVRRDFRRRRSL